MSAPEFGKHGHFGVVLCEVCDARDTPTPEVLQRLAEARTVEREAVSTHECHTAYRNLLAAVDAVLAEVGR